MLLRVFVDFVIRMTVSSVYESVCCSYAWAALERCILRGTEGWLVGVGVYDRMLCLLGWR